MKPNPLCVALMLGISLLSLSSSRAAQPLPRSTPEGQGISSQAIRDFVSTVDKIDTLHSFMLLRHRHVVVDALK